MKKYENRFGKILVIQLISFIVVHLSDFTISLLAYEKFSSLRLFTLISFATLAPEIIFSSLVGVLVDKFGLIRSIKIGQLGALFSVIALFLLLYEYKILLVLCVAFSSIFNTFLLVTLPKIVRDYVAPDKLNRMNGLIETCFSLSRTAAPAISGCLLFVLKPLGVIAMIIVTSSLSVIAIHIIPNIQNASPSKESSFQKTIPSIKYSILYLFKDKLLLSLIIYYAFINYLLGLVQVLFIPLIFSSTGHIGYTMIITVSGCGLIAGSLLMFALDGPKNKILAILVSTTIVGFILTLSVGQLTMIKLASGAFVVMALINILRICDATFWQLRVDGSIFASVYGLKSTLIASSLPLAYLSSYPIIHYIIQPLYSTFGDFNAHTMVNYISCLYSISGSILIIISAFMYLYIKFYLSKDYLMRGFSV